MFEDYFKYDSDITFITSKTITSYDNVVYLLSESKMDFSIFIDEVKQVKRHKKGSSIIIRLGKYKEGTRDQALLNIVSCLFDMLTYDIPILIETHFNINYLGSTIEDLSFIFKRIKHKNLLVCINTSNVFRAGYPIHKPEHLLTYFVSFGIKIGLERIGLCYLCESTKGPFNYPNMNLFEDQETLNVYGLLSGVFPVKGRPISPFYSEELELLFKTITILTFIQKYIKRHKLLNRTTDELFSLKKMVSSVFSGGEYKLVKTNYGYDFNFSHSLSDAFVKMLNSNTFIFEDEKIYQSLKSLSSYGCFKKEDINILSSLNLYSLEDVKELPLARRKKLLTAEQNNLITYSRFIRHICYDIAEEIVTQILTMSTNILCGEMYNAIRKGTRGLVSKIETLSTFEERELNVNLVLSLFVCKTVFHTSETKINCIMSYKKRFFVLEMNFCSSEDYKNTLEHITCTKEKKKRIKELTMAFN